MGAARRLSLDAAGGHLPRLLSKDGICAYLGGISAATYDQWAARGLVPGPLAGTKFYDVKAHDALLDQLSRLDRPEHRSALAEWMAAQGKAG